MKKTIFLNILLISMLLTGCRIQKELANNSVSTTADTVKIVEILRDTVVEIAPDSAMIRALLECDSIGQVRIRRLLDYQAGERLKPPEINVKNNVLTAKAETDSMGIYLTMKDRYEIHIRDQTTEETKIIEVNRLTKWQKFWVRFGQLGSVALLVFTGFKIVKTIKRIRYGKID